MAITLASDSWSDAEVTDGIGRGDLASAARLWVRHWPTALDASALLVVPAEVPGLAAEALIGTISVIATGRGLREDVAAFVAAAVRELGEDDEPFVPGEQEQLPAVFVSPLMSAAFGGLPVDDQLALRARLGRAQIQALSVLQAGYLAEHLGSAPTRDCRQAHTALIAVADGTAGSAFGSEHWLHLSICAWCTEAFHELAFSSVALEDLVAPEVLDRARVPVPAPVAVAPAEAVAGPIAAVHRRAPSGIRNNRNRVLAAAALTAAGAVTVLLASHYLAADDSAAPSAASSRSTSAPVPTPSADQRQALVDPPLVPTRARKVVRPPKPTPSATVSTASSLSPSSAPTKRPAPHPHPSPGPTHTPSTGPTAAPSKACNPLQHVLAFC